MTDAATEIDREASSWIARLADPGTGEAERRAFRDWLAMSPAHRDAADRMASLWRGLDASAEDATIRAERRRARRWRLANAQDGPGLRRRPLLIGGALAACLAAGIFYVPGMLPQQPQSVRYATTQDERLTATLADGTVATLDLDTEILVTQAPHWRRVQVVKGEVLLAVKHDRTRPLDAVTDLVSVRATGTEFAVRALPDATRVVLVEGGVRVADLASPATSVLLLPGQEARMARAQRIVVRPVDPAAALAWRQGRVVFRATPLAEAVAEINRYAARPILLDAKIGAHEINGTFETGDTRKFAQTLSRILPVTLRERGDGALLLEPRAR